MAVPHRRQRAQQLVRLLGGDVAQQPGHDEADGPRRGVVREEGHEGPHRRQAHGHQGGAGAAPRGGGQEGVHQRGHEARIGHPGGGPERGAPHHGVGIGEQPAQGPVRVRAQRAQGARGLHPLVAQGGREHPAQLRPADDATLQAAVAQQAGQRRDPHPPRGVLETRGEEVHRLVAGEGGVGGGGRLADVGVRVAAAPPRPGRRPPRRARRVPAARRPAPSDRRGAPASRRPARSCGPARRPAAPAPRGCGRGSPSSRLRSSARRPAASSTCSCSSASSPRALSVALEGPEVAAARLGDDAEPDHHDRHGEEREQLHVPRRDQRRHERRAPGRPGRTTAA